MREVLSTALRDPRLHGPRRPAPPSVGCRHRLPRGVRGVDREHGGPPRRRRLPAADRGEDLRSGAAADPQPALVCGARVEASCRGPDVRARVLLVVSGRQHVRHGRDPKGPDLDALVAVGGRPGERDRQGGPWRTPTPHGPPPPIVRATKRPARSASSPKREAVPVQAPAVAVHSGSGTQTSASGVLLLSSLHSLSWPIILSSSSTTAKISLGSCAVSNLKATFSLAPAGSGPTV